MGDGFIPWALTPPYKTLLGTPCRWASQRCLWYADLETKIFQWNWLMNAWIRALVTNYWDFKRETKGEPDLMLVHLLSSNIPQRSILPMSLCYNRKCGKLISKFTLLGLSSWMALLLNLLASKLTRDVSHGLCACREVGWGSESGCGIGCYWR